MNSLQLEVVWTDSDGMLKLAVMATSATHSAYHETYLYPESLAEFAVALETFPGGEAVLECGARDPTYHDYLRLRAFLVKPTGQAALEFESDVRGLPPVRAEAHFYVRGLPMNFNRLGSALKAWLSDTSEPIRLEWEDGWA